jgi:hypothetical protein
MPYIVRVLPRCCQEKAGNQLLGGPNKLPFDRATRSIFANRVPQTCSSMYTCLLLKENDVEGFFTFEA